MGNNKYTELDKLFQSKLEGDKVENGEWNNPTDDAFFSAMREIGQEEKPSKKKIVWWPYLFLLFIPLGILGIWNANQVNELKTEIDEIYVNSNKENATSEAIIQEQTIKTDSKTILSEQNVLENKSLPTQKFISSPQNNALTESKANAKITNQQKQNNTIYFTSVNANDEIKNNSTPNNGRTASKNALEDSSPLSLGLGKLDELSSIDKIGQNGVSSKNEKRSLPNANSFAFILDKDLSPIDKSLAAYAFLDVNLNSLRMTGMEPTSFSLTGYDKSYLGYELGLGLIQKVNKRVAINYSASYKQVKNRSFYENDFMFEEDKLHTDVDGQLIYQLFSELQTPTGAYISSQDLSFEDNSMADKEMMNQNANIELLFNFVSLGVKPRVSLLQKERFNVFAEAGLNLNYLVHYCQSLDMKYYYEDKMMMEDYVDNFSMSELNRFSLATSLGLGLEYNLGEHFFSSFKVGTSRSLNSIKQIAANGDQTRTYIDNLGFSLTAGYRF